MDAHRAFAVRHPRQSNRLFYSSRASLERDLIAEVDRGEERKKWEVKKEAGENGSEQLWRHSKRCQVIL